MQVYQRTKQQYDVSARDIVVNTLFNYQDDGSISVVAYSDDQDDGYKDDNEKNIIRMKMPMGGFIIEPDPKNASKSVMKLVFEINVGGDMPVQIMKQTLSD